jgi:hypothetical protein
MLSVFIHMRDANFVKGTVINYMDEDWTVSDFYFYPGNPRIYVGLKKGGIQMNVDLESIKSIITSLNYSLDLQESF